MRKSKLVLIILLVLVVAMAFALVACNNNSGNDNQNNQNNQNNNGGENDGNVTYTINVQRSGGIPFSKISVIVYDENRNIKAYAQTDDNGVATFEAPKSTYTLEFGWLPQGYDGKGDYVIDAGETSKTFKLKASLLTDMVDLTKKYSIGDVMNNFAFTDSTGKSSSLSEILKTKKAAVINFWYVGCSACVSEFPDLKKAYLEYQNDIELIAISNQDNNREIEDFRNNKSGMYDWDELPFSMVAYDDEYSAAMLTSFSAREFPTTIVVDREGVICAIEKGAGDYSEFVKLFEAVSSDDYQQQIFYEGVDSMEKPNVTAPASSEIEKAINNTSSGLLCSYYFDEDEYNWPWVVDGDCIKPANTNKNNSYSIIYSDISLTTTHALTFDFKVSSELDNDMFYVFINNDLIHEYSGVDKDWQTCYAYIPEKNGTYRLGLSYSKDSSRAAGDDTVIIKNMRYVPINQIDQYTTILQGCASGKIASSGNKYASYITDVYNEDDGYYHVGSKDGPLILADLMNPTNWSNDGAWNYVNNGGLFLDINGDGEKESLKDLFAMYAQIANSSNIYGKLAVNFELRVLLEALVGTYGQQYHENEWLELCYYYNVYCGDNISDPAEGLGYYNAFNTLCGDDVNNLPLNHVVKTKLIMPRGIWFVFVPSETSIYNVRSVGQIDSYVWIRNEQLEEIFENDDDFNFQGPLEESYNFSVTMYMEQGKKYYILCDYKAPEVVGEFDFVVEKLAVKGNVWVPACGEYTSELDEEGNYHPIISNATQYTLVDDGFYHAVNVDGTIGSKIYIDLLSPTNLFTSMGVKSMLDMSTYYCKLCGYLYQDSVSNFEKTENPKCGMCQRTKSKADFEKRKVFELPTAIRGEDGNIICMKYDFTDGTSELVPCYELNGKEFNAETYLSDLAEYGIKFVDYTDIVKAYVLDSETNYASEPEVGHISEHVGFVAASQELVDILTKFIVFGDYGYLNLSNTWLKMAYYYMPLG